MESITSRPPGEVRKILTLPCAIRKMPAHSSPSQNSTSSAANRRSTARCARPCTSLSLRAANSGIWERAASLGGKPLSYCRRSWQCEANSCFPRARTVISCQPNQLREPRVCGAESIRKCSAIVELDGSWFVAYCALVPGANGQMSVWRTCVRQLHSFRNTSAAKVAPRFRRTIDFERQLPEPAAPLHREDHADPVRSV